MDDQGGSATDYHVSGTNTRILIGYIRDHLGTETVEAVLDLADERRPVELLVQDAQWSSYEQFRRLLEAASTVLGGPHGLAHYGEFLSLGAAANPDDLDMFQAFGSPGAFYAAIRENAAHTTPILDASAEQIGPTDWVISAKLRDGFEPFEEHCFHYAGLLSFTTMLFGLPPADVVEEGCQRAGAPVCRYRIRWNAIDEATQRAEFLGSRVTVLQSRLEALQLTVADLVSGDNLQDVLTRIVESAAAAVRAPVYVLAIGSEGSAPDRVYSKGVADGEAARIAEALLNGGGRGDDWLVVEVASTRRDYGRLAAIQPTGERFFSQEHATLEAYGRLAAAALDSATAIEEARRQTTTAKTLLELSVSLGSITTAEDAAAKLVRAIPVIVDCDRAMVVLIDPDNSAGNIAASFGYPDDVAAEFQSVFVNRPIGEATVTNAFQYFDVRSDDDNSGGRELMQRTGDLAAAVVPIVFNDQRTGWVIAAVTDRPERLGPPEELVERLGGLAAQAATTIANARLLDQIRHQSLHDPLTSVANRALIMDRVEKMQARGRRHYLPVAVLFIDLDGFKDINDSLGHDAGDQLLRAVATRLQGAVRVSDTVGRLGGDEFIVLVEGDGSDARPELVARRLLDDLHQPFQLSGYGDPTLTITASIGIAIGDRPTPGELLRDADVALYEAKRAGKNRFVVFTRDMHGTIAMRVQREADLSVALEASSSSFSTS
jgi:diguanylate cyclase (GGDEF)-like protein